MNGTFSGVLEYAGGVRADGGGVGTGFEYDGIVNGAIQYRLSMKVTGIITTVKSINLTPFKKVRFFYSASPGYNYKDWTKIYATILDTNKKTIGSWRDDYSVIDFGTTGTTQAYDWNISRINQQAFITIWIAQGNRGNTLITYRIPRIEFMV